MRCCEDRQLLVQALARTSVPVIAVHVGQDDGIERRQLARLHRGFGTTLRPQPVAEVGTFAAVQKVRVGQQRERPKSDNRGCRSDEGQLLSHPTDMPRGGTPEPRGGEPRQLARSGQPTYSHSMVPGGLLVMSTTTRLTAGTSLVMRVEM